MPYPQIVPTIEKAPDDKTWLLTVQCPFCTKQHTHGGGSDLEPGLFGTRGAHCQSGDGMYELVAPDSKT
ncbi:hypothetical protein ACFPA8_12330 [Streptomyces ovatisporus]|uniref:Uncharacterized protein n=1 Tax=Streptomyces ovatisporus TaxID=1128682 RepID=A0ABV9A6P2_9ACTN